MRIRRRAGFTLIELIATIVVIVIVSAVAVDHFGTTAV
jgi:prepilin-type N-terminal cleavage/methylation domain-containing protein